MVLSVTTWALVVLVTCILAWRWNRRSLEKLAEQIPGPAPLPLVGNALELGSNTIEIYQNLKRLTSKYFPLCRLWLGPKLYILVLDAKDIEIVLSNPKYITKAMSYTFLHPWLGTGLLTSAGEKWHKHRKFITPTFHFKILEQFLHSFNSKADVLIKRLEKEANGQSFDIYKYMTLYTLDTITDTAMGLDINAQTDETSSYVAAVKKQGELIMNRMMKPWLYPAFIFNLTPNGKTQRESLKVLHNTTDKMIKEKKNAMNNAGNSDLKRNDDSDVGIKRRPAFLDLLLEKNTESVSFSDTNLREEVDTFMFEGHDTTSSSLSFSMWLLAKHQNVQEKVYNEVKSILTSTDMPTTQTLNEMKYLDCVIKESLRLYPSVPLLAREIHEDIKVTRQKFAMLEMKLAVAKVLMQYKLLPDEEFEPILSAELIVKSVNGIKIKIVPRQD